MGLSHAVGFFGGPAATIGTVPASLELMAALFNAKVGGSHERLTLKIPLSALREAMIEPWHFTTDTGSLPFADATIIGNIQFAFQLSNAVAAAYPVGQWALIRGEIEFSEPISVSDALPYFGPSFSSATHKREDPDAKSAFEHVPKIDRGPKEMSDDDMSYIVSKLLANGYVVQPPVPFVSGKK